jgi:glycosyltransferase involved in cell wall biosynthesis
MRYPPVGIVCDLFDERWVSMDLVADELVEALRGRAAGVDPVVFRPAMPRRLPSLPGVLRPLGAGGTAERLFNRYREYPRWLLANHRDLPVYHVIDHSYAHLVAALPAGRSIVTCHDLDAFRCVLEPAAERRPAWFRALAQRTLDGLRQAARVVCVSDAVRRELLSHGIADDARVSVAANGVVASFAPEPDPTADAEAARLLGPQPSHPEVVSVGSTIPRKRLDVLIRAFAALMSSHADARLIRVGGLTAEQKGLAASLGALPRIVEVPFVERRVLAAIYRRGAMSMVTSDREGFGLPVAESLACGTPVVASDIPALRETGGDAAVYCPAGDAGAFATAAARLIDEPEHLRDARAAEGRAHAGRFTWESHAAHAETLYRDVAAGMATEQHS